MNSNMSIKTKTENFNRGQIKSFFSRYLVNSSDRENLRGQLSTGHENGRSCNGVFDGRFE